MTNFENLPIEMTRVNRWMVWKFVKSGKNVTKVPFQATATDVRASSTDPKTWSSCNEAIGAVEDGKADGIGFALGNGFVGVDIDACRDPKTGKKTDLAQEIVDELASYTEASPSGKGVHVILKARGLPEGWRSKDGVEMYSEGRYFTMTGERLGVHTNVEERTLVLARVHARLAGILKSIPRTLENPEDQLIRKFDSSKGVVDAYTAKVNRKTGKASCNCKGWKNRMRSGHPCWHVQKLADEIGIEPMM